MADIVAPETRTAYPFEIPRSAGADTAIEEDADPMDDDAFVQFWRENVRVAKSVALRRLGNAEDAEDVVQLAFLQLYRKRQVITTHPRGYFYAILNNGCVDRLKLRGRLARREAAAGSGGTEPPQIEAYRTAPEDPAETVARFALRRWVRELLAGLADDDAATLLRHYAGLTDREIGEEIGATEAATKQRRYRAMRRLGEALRARGLRDAEAVRRELGEE